MNKLMRSEQKVVDQLEPVIKRMKPERAAQLSTALSSLQDVAEAAKAMARSIEASKPLEDADCARYTEGLNEHDAEILRVWLKQQAEELESIYNHLGVSKEDLYENLSRIAEDVWNDAPQEEIAATD